MHFLSAAINTGDDADNVQGKWIGLGIVIASAVLSNLGVNVQKLSHVRVRPTLTLLITDVHQCALVIHDTRPCALVIHDTHPCALEIYDMLS